MYRLIARREAGQLAEWFRAERLEEGTADRPVAIKLLHAQTSDVDYARAMAVTSRGLADLAVPGIARILEIGEVGGRLAIVSEPLGRYTTAEVLGRLHSRDVYLAPALALAFVLDVLELLARVHSAGLVQGALNPATVVLTDGGRAGLIEFGSYEALRASPSLRRAFAGKGRSAYRAPELTGAEAATPASDLYAVSAMAYELLTLREAVLEGPAVSTRGGRLPAPSRLVRRLSSRLDPIVMRSLDAAPARRHRSCADFAQGLRDYLLNEGGVPPADELRAFVAGLLPNEVVLEARGPVPFTAPFSLGPLGGVRVRAEDLEGFDVLARNSFSGPSPIEPGEWDDEAQQPDSANPDGVAASRAAEPDSALRDDSGKESLVAADARKTVPEMIAADARKTVPEMGVSDARRTAPEREFEGPSPEASVASTPLPVGGWEAPPAAVAAGRPAPVSDGEEVLRRIRAREDFAPLEGHGDTLRDSQGGREMGSSGAAAPPRATLVNFVTAFHRTDLPQPPRLADERAEAVRAARVAASTGALILTALVLFVLGNWLLASNDPVGDLAAQLPRPLRVLLVDATGARGSSNAPLRPFDVVGIEGVKIKRVHLKKARSPAPTVVAREGARRSSEGLAPSCVPRSPGPSDGWLALRSKRTLQVEVDGRVACGAPGPLALPAGLHRVRAVDRETGDVAVFTQRIEVGKTVKVSPVFKGP